MVLNPPTFSNYPFFFCPGQADPVPSGILFVFVVCVCDFPFSFPVALTCSSSLFYPHNQDLVIVFWLLGFFFFFYRLAPPFFLWWGRMW